jgi:hypothetical protein
MMVQSAAGSVQRSRPHRYTLPATVFQHLLAAGQCVLSGALEKLQVTSFYALFRERNQRRAAGRAVA